MITRRTLLSLPVLALAPSGHLPPQLLIIGDSLSRGAYASSLAACYAARLSVALGAVDTCEQRPIRDLPGAEVAWAEVAGRPWDLIVLEIGINDTISGPVTDAWRDRIGVLLSAMRVTGARVIACTPFDIGVAELAEDLYQRAGAVRDAAAAAGVALADVYGASHNRPGLRARVGDLTFYGESTRAEDTLHPNNAGHAVVAATILSALRYTVALPAV